MVFGEVVSAIGVAFVPENFKLALADSIADPIESHVDGFGPFLFYGVGGDAAGGIIVGGHRGGGLWMAHFLEGNS